jgi:membrane protease YdiL (CAAX protease family)
MLQNSSEIAPEIARVSPLRRVATIIGLPVWVFFGFMLAQALILAIIALIQSTGFSFDTINTAIFNAVGGVIIYGLAILLVFGVPWVVMKRRTTREDIGLKSTPRWMDLLWAPAGMVAYLILTTIVTQVAMQFLTFVDYSQTQQTGFSDLATRPEYAIAFISLVIVAPLAEEILFRGYLLGKLRKYAPLWLSILITSALFALVHFQWNVAIDVFVLSVVLCVLRVYTGSLWASILLHMLKNGVAYYFLFINPSLLSTMG